MLSRLRGSLLLVALVGVQTTAAQVDGKLKDCLTAAVHGDQSRAAWNTKASFELQDVKPYNLYYEIKPTAVTYPQTAEEVGSIVKCAAAAKVPVQARSGGHSFGNYGIGGDDGAVVVDTRHLNRLSYDGSDKTAHIGPGNRLKNVNDFLAQQKRLASHGVAGQVGVGGHYTIGGLGHVSRQYGTASDNIIDAEVVIANGSIIKASKDENSDVFFAIRGAGASFGIVTDFHIQTHPIPGQAIAYSFNVTLGPASIQADALKAWQKLVSDPALSRKFSSQFIVFPGGSIITGYFYGTQKEFSALNVQAAIPGLDPSAITIQVVDAAVAAVNDISELGLQLIGDTPAHFYSKSLAFSNKTLLTNEAIDDVFRYLGGLDLTQLGVIYFVIFDLEGGAINDVPTSSSAYAFRDTLYFLQSYAVDFVGLFEDESRKLLDGLNDVILARDTNAFGAYPGYVDPFLKNARKQYWGDNLAQLKKIKKVRDPNEVFKNPQSVKPRD